MQQKQQIMNSISDIEVVISELRDFVNKNKDIITKEDKDNFQFILSDFNSVAADLKMVIENQKENIEVSN